MREMGVRLIVYIDDILIMAKSETMLRDGVVYLLQNLGFVINSPKSLLEPWQSIDFLGFLVNSLFMELELPGEKIRNIRVEARKLLAAKQVTALMLSRLLGKMNAATKAITMAPLFYWQLQADLQQALHSSDQDYSTPIRLWPMAREELELWNTHFTNWNGWSCHAVDSLPQIVVPPDCLPRRTLSPRTKCRYDIRSPLAMNSPPTASLQCSSAELSSCRTASVILH